MQKRSAYEAQPHISAVSNHSAKHIYGARAITRHTKDLVAGDASGDYTRLPVHDPGQDHINHVKQVVERSEQIALDRTQPQPPRTLLADALETKAFQGAMASTIMLNAFVMGCETDWPNVKCWDQVELAFLFVFFADVTLKFYVQGSYFLAMANMDISWNIFDLFVVSLGLIDAILSSVVSKSGNDYAALFRIIRLLRIVRLFRLVKFLKQLYLLAFGFAEAIQAILWVSIFMFVVLYVCSIVMVRTIGSLPETDPNAEFLHEQFPDMGTSMLTLFVLMSSPNLPDYLAEDGLLWRHPLLLLFLISFIVIGSFGMIALLTGVISESMFEKNQLRLDEARKDQDELMMNLELKTAEIHSGLKLDEEGNATPEEVAAKAMPSIAELFENAMIDYTDYQLRQLVEVMDLSGNGVIGQKEFTHAIVTYAAGVKPLSIQEVHYGVTVCMHKLEVVEATLNELKSSKWSCGDHSRDEPGRVPVVPLLEAPPPATAEDGLEACGSERITTSMSSLEACVRECTAQQLVGQRHLETSVQQGFDELQERLRERLAVSIADWRRVPLPGKYEIGDRVVSRIDCSFDSGHVRRHDIGVVRGPSTGEESGRVNVDFPNLRSANMLPSQIQAEEAIPTDMDPSASRSRNNGLVSSPIACNGLVSSPISATRAAGGVSLAYAEIPTNTP